MNQALPLLVTPLFLGSAASADLPRSLNFTDQTAGRITMLDEAFSPNEKEVEFGDVDMDGDPDVVIAVAFSDFGQRHNKLYINDDGVFNEVSGTLIIPDFGMTDVSRNAFIRDFTGDGWNDIYITNDNNSGGFAGSEKLYVAHYRDGVLTHFENEAVTRLPNGGNYGTTCGGVSVDFDQDKDWDVYSGNYANISQDMGTYNDGSGFFTDVTPTLIPADFDYTTDVAAADMNGDGKIDVLLSLWQGNMIYYNDNGKGSTGLGDFRYTGSEQDLESSEINENAMEPADFDNDGDMDVYWSNVGPSGADRVLRNDGNDASNQAILTLIDVVPSSVTPYSSRKASVADLNDDGRIDVLVGNYQNFRPAVLRNTTVNGDISFVDWTPAPAFPANSLSGWHGALFDTGGDGDVDILLGAFVGDHLMENVPANEVTEGGLSTGFLPALWDLDPVAVTGEGLLGDVDTYGIPGAGDGYLAIVLNGPHDYRLEVRQGAATLATVDRGGPGVEEAIQIETTDVSYRIVVTVLAEAPCPFDIDDDCIVGTPELLQLLADWGATGIDDLLELLAHWSPGAVETDYLLEVLGRGD